MSQESIKNMHTLDINFTPSLIGDYQFQKLDFTGICLNQDSVPFLHKKVVNLYIL